MATLNQSPLNTQPINGPTLASLPDTEEICFDRVAVEDEIEILGAPAPWEPSFTDLIADWQLSFTAEIQEC
jgi:hypothetical protein